MKIISPILLILAICFETVEVTAASTALQPASQKDAQKSAVEKMKKGLNALKDMSEGKLGMSKWNHIWPILAVLLFATLFCFVTGKLIRLLLVVALSWALLFMIMANLPFARKLAFDWLKGKVPDDAKAEFEKMEKTIIEEVCKKHGFEKKSA